MSPLENPEYKDEAQAIVEAVNSIVTTVKAHGFGTVSVMLILSEMMNLSVVVNNFNTLPTEQRDEFFAEVWDAAIGNEEYALVTQVGVFSGEYLEAISDGMKGAALAYFNKQIALPA